MNYEQVAVFGGHALAVQALAEEIAQFSDGDPEQIARAAIRSGCQRFKEMRPAELQKLLEGMNPKHLED